MVGIFPHDKPRHQPSRRLAVLAAVLVAALFVGNTLLASSNVTPFSYMWPFAGMADQQLAVKTSAGIYIGGSEDIARLDVRNGTNS